MGHVSDVLARKGSEVHTIGRRATVYEAIEAMAMHNVGALVVLDESGEVCGILTERDYLRRVALENRSSPSTPVDAIMSSPVHYADHSEPIHRTMEAMTEKRCRHFPVRGDRGELVGIVSIGDLVKYLVTEQQNEIQQLHEYIQSA